ncbi:putative WD domain G-beta repeat domain-containing protein [Phytophthora infestans]|uniref:Putative WD domain G-beta repeat domain-containing protein n=1 Tax=Phytophthora infestans TaxID=4787 RepID=A0A8S9TNU8_PHYIN|nr:putative WD domain G-beta repeat domain-containing protein [Phytophthora infestans]
MIKKRDLDEWARQEKAVQAGFLTLIKRAKKKPAAGGKEEGKEPASARDGEEQEAEDEKEEDEDEGYDEDDDDDDEEEEDTCPSECDLTLYEKVLVLREKRADVDEVMEELNKAIEELRKAEERQTAKQRAIDKALAATEQDTQQFQSEKQSRFNQTGHYLFKLLAASCSAFSALSERIESLQVENKKLRQQFRDLHKQQNVLAKEKRQQQEVIARAQDRGEHLMRLKFGQLVNLEVLDRACDASSVDELQTRVKLREVEGERSLRICIPKSISLEKKTQSRADTKNEIN